MKYLILIVLFTLMIPQLAFSETATFKVSATIPFIEGVNYFPETVDFTAEDNAALERMMITETTSRNGQRIVLQTNIIK